MTSLRTLTHESLLPPTLNASSPLLRRPLRLYDMLADNAKEQLGPYLEGEIVTPGSIPCHALQVFLESLCRGRSKSTRIRPAIRAPPVHAVRMIARRVCAQKTRSGSANGWHLTRDKFSVGFGAGDHLGDSSISNRRILLRSARTEHRTPARQRGKASGTHTSEIKKGSTESRACPQEACQQRSAMCARTHARADKCHSTAY